MLILSEGSSSEGKYAKLCGMKIRIFKNYYNLYHFIPIISLWVNEPVIFIEVFSNSYKGSLNCECVVRNLIHRT